MAFRQGAASKHPLTGAVTEPQRRRKAISGSTLWAARLLFACCVARQSQIQWDMLFPRALRALKIHCRKC